MKDNKKIVVAFSSVIVVLIGIIIALVLFLTGKKEEESKPYVKSPGYTNSDRITDEPELGENEMSIPGMYECYVSPSEPMIYLTNPEINNVRLDYVIYDTEGAEIFRAEKIEPGMACEWNGYEQFGNGETYDTKFTASICATPDDVGKGISPSYNQEVTVHVYAD